MYQLKPVSVQAVVLENFGRPCPRAFSVTLTSKVVEYNYRDIINQQETVKYCDIKYHIPSLFQIGVVLETIKPTDILCNKKLERLLVSKNYSVAPTVPKLCKVSAKFILYFNHRF